MMSGFSTVNIANIPLVEEQYARYLKDPASVDSSWRHFFDGIDFASHLYRRSSKESSDALSCRILQLIDAYRRFGHLWAKTDPLEKEKPCPPELELKTLGFEPGELKMLFPSYGWCGKEMASLQEIIDALQSVYSNKIGYEYMDLGSQEMEKWIEERIEKGQSFQLKAEEKHLILEYLNKSEVLESFLHTKYPGQTRFSLDGNEMLIPILADLILEGAKKGIEGFVLGMPHRGRLNVLMNILQKPYSILFKEFEDVLPYLESETGDAKYHKGFSSDIQAGDRKVHLHLAANSSCLESVDGIVLGQTRAKQVEAGDEKKERFCAILMHGDAAMAGQGVVYETLQMSKLEGFSTGGTIHIAINNQVGFTTVPSEGRSTRYCTDIAKTFGMPVFHVNAEDPEGCIFAARLAIEIRQKFHLDVFIDLIGYRKYGHNEGDEPGFTQPLYYQKIKNRKPVRKLYLEELSSEGTMGKNIVEEMETEFKKLLSDAFDRGKVEEKVEPEERFGSAWGDFVQPPDETLFLPFPTKVDAATLKKIIKAYATIPKNFHIHPKLAKWLQGREAQLAKDPKTPSIDWGVGECLAFGSLLLEGKPIRLSGQDSKRGTFSQRHAVWFDQSDEHPYIPYDHIGENQAKFDVNNTILSEYGALAFEFGYSWSSPNSLTLWEAQYGDFDIGAEIAIDHYIVAGEQKWARYSSLVMLLPHAYEGSGPEHSSARPERFLQLSAGCNIQLSYPSTPAQYFHLLRRQALRPIKKPLIVLTPKSLLRLPSCVSSLNDFTNGEFLEFIDAGTGSEKKLIFCSGKIYYDILGIKDDLGNAAIIRVEQVAPFHEEKMKMILAKYAGAEECVWVQEEPINMGFWDFLHPIFTKILPKTMKLNVIARPRSGATATGSHKMHQKQQAAILNALKEKK